MVTKDEIIKLYRKKISAPIIPGSVHYTDYYSDPSKFNDLHEKSRKTGLNVGLYYLDNGGNKVFAPGIKGVDIYGDISHLEGTPAMKDYRARMEAWENARKTLDYAYWINQEPGGLGYDIRSEYAAQTEQPYNGPRGEIYGNKMPLPLEVSTIKARAPDIVKPTQALRINLNIANVEGKIPYRPKTSTNMISPVSPIIKENPRYLPNGPMSINPVISGERSNQNISRRPDDFNSKSTLDRTVSVGMATFNPNARNISMYETLMPRGPTRDPVPISQTTLLTPLAQMSQMPPEAQRLPVGRSMSGMVLGQFGAVKADVQKMNKGKQVEKKTQLLKPYDFQKALNKAMQGPKMINLTRSSQKTKQTLEDLTGKITKLIGKQKGIKF
jgi:hypothetical protein